MHLAINARDRFAGLYQDQTIVIQPKRTLLKDRRNDRCSGFIRDLCQRMRRWAVERFGKIKEICVFFLTEILRAKHLRQTDDLCSFAGSLARELDGSFQVLIYVRTHGHLNQPYLIFFAFSHNDKDTIIAGNP